MASQKKRKRSIIDELFGNSIFDELESLDEFPANGYSIASCKRQKEQKSKQKLEKTQTQTRSRNNFNDNTQTRR